MHTCMYLCWYRYIPFLMCTAIFIYIYSCFTYMYIYIYVSYSYTFAHLFGTVPVFFQLEICTNPNDPRPGTQCAKKPIMQAIWTCLFEYSLTQHLLFVIENYTNMTCDHKPWRLMSIMIPARDPKQWNRHPLQKFY